MKIVLLDKALEDYPKKEYLEEKLIESRFNADFIEHNRRAIRHRLDTDFGSEVMENFVMDGNVLNTTDEIIAAVRVIKHLDILTEEEWGRAIPIIERGLEANKAYVRMIDEMSPILERYCKEYEDVLMRNTFMERIHLECWQGRFSLHQLNPNQEPNYF